MSKKSLAQAPFQMAEQAWRGYQRTVPGGSLSKKDFEDAFFAGRGSSKWNTVDSVVRRESAEAMSGRGGALTQRAPTSKLRGPESVTEAPGVKTYHLEPTAPVAAPAAKPRPMAGGITTLQTALNALHTLVKGIPGWVDDTFANAPKAKAALGDLISPLRNYGLNGAQIKLTNKLDPDTIKQYYLAKKLKEELSTMTPVTLWGEKARENVAALQGNMAAIKTLKDAANDIMDEITPATAEAAGAAINRTSNNLQNALNPLMELPTVELEEEEEGEELLELDDKGKRWARWLARERVNAAIARKDIPPADAAALRSSARARKAIDNEYKRISDILRDPNQASQLVGSADDNQEERQAKIDYYKTTGRLATARVDFDGIRKLSHEYLTLVKA